MGRWALALLLLAIGPGGTVGKKRKRKTTLTTTTTFIVRYHEVGPYASAKFMEENKKKEGVIVTNSGLQYKWIERGNGTGHPKEDVANDIKYSGWLVNGFRFDTSDTRDPPWAFINPSNMLEGQEEAMYLMVEGDTIEIYLPPYLAYDDEGREPYIPPNSSVIFRIHLMRIRGPRMDDDGNMIDAPPNWDKLYNDNGTLLTNDNMKTMGANLKEAPEPVVKDEEDLADDEAERLESLAKQAGREERRAKEKARQLKEKAKQLRREKKRLEGLAKREAREKRRAAQKARSAREDGEL